VSYFSHIVDVVRRENVKSLAWGRAIHAIERNSHFMRFDKDWEITPIILNKEA
jgi:hypothetical protein